ncbi:MAG: DUF5615 family PIN-like protein [Vulcanimicrobiota bacterium]
MKFLIDMNMPRRVGNRLNTKGHEFRHAGDIGLAKAADTSIIEEARKNNEVIVTHDLDYSHLLAFSGEPDPSEGIVSTSSMIRSRDYNAFNCSSSFL